MKIGLVCPYNISRAGGVQECVLALQSRLIERGHEVFIITPQPRLLQGEVLPNIIFLGTGAEIKSVFHTTGQVSVNVNNEVIDQVLTEHQFDILHFHEPWVPMVSRQILTHSKSINIATFHAKLPETMMARTVERVITPYTRSVLKYFDGLTAVSEAASEYVHSLTNDHIHIIPNGIDLDYYTAPKQTSKSLEVLYVGRLEKRKGLKFLLKAWQHVTESYPMAKLKIVGDGADRIKLEAYAASLQLENVEFLGYVDNTQKLALLKQAMIFCSPAPYGESFGIVLLEAMATGLPIVAGDNAGYRGVLKGRGALSLVDPRDTTEFQRRLEVLLGDPELRVLLRTWELDYVQQFSYARVTDEYEKFYQRLIAKK